ncbi:MAG: hypothetical protein U0528_13035 [Anaerolineae bacterium]
MITIRKLDDNGREVFSYKGELVERGDNWIWWKRISPATMWTMVTWFSAKGSLP